MPAESPSRVNDRFLMRAPELIRHLFEAFSNGIGSRPNGERGRRELRPLLHRAVPSCLPVHCERCRACNRAELCLAPQASFDGAARALSDPVQWEFSKLPNKAKSKYESWPVSEPIGKGPDRFISSSYTVAVSRCAAIGKDNPRLPTYFSKASLVSSVRFLRATSLPCDT
jgi:hypothetical protein